jgi:D-sedoheptulose 7-phosphate isomerase
MMFSKRLNELKDLLQSCAPTKMGLEISIDEAMQEFHKLLSDLVAQKGKVYVIGNGGSSGIASHFANDLLKTLKIPALTLTDSNYLTCFANDFGYEYVFSQPLETLGQKEDLLVAISSSGKSQNIINAVKTAKEKKMRTVTLSGFLNSNPLRMLGDINFWIDKTDYGLVESAHFFILHTVVDLWTIKNILSRKQSELLCKTK